MFRNILFRLILSLFKWVNCAKILSQVNRSDRLFCVNILFLTGLIGINTCMTNTKYPC